MPFKQLIALVTLTWVCAAWADDDFPTAFDPAPLSRFKPSKVLNYGKPLLPIKKLLADENKNHRTQHFCVIGYQFSNGQVAWVHWVEEKRLILWEQSNESSAIETSLTHSRRDLKLNVDTVKTIDDINGSSYLVTRDWWQAVAKDCAKYGEKATVKAFH
jgi:hypothetical protein